jgi:hypothetical protein
MYAWWVSGCFCLQFDFRCIAALQQLLSVLHCSIYGIYVSPATHWQQGRFPFDGYRSMMTAVIDNKWLGLLGAAKGFTANSFYI